MPQVELTSGKTGNKFIVDFDSDPTQQDVDFALSQLETAAPSSPPTSRPTSEGRLATPTFTPTQLGALEAGIGPLASLIGRQLRGDPVTRTEAIAEGALEEISRMPAALGELGLQGMNPPSVRLATRLGESLGVLPKDSLNSFIKNIVSPAVQAPGTIASALGIEQGPERAKFRDPTGAAIGEVGTIFLNPVVEEAKVGESVGKLPGAIRSSVEKLSSRGITRAPLEDAVTRATGITAQEGSLELAPIVKSQVLQVGGRPQTAQKALAAADKASENVIGKALNGLEQAEAQGLAFIGDSALEAGRQKVLFDFPSLRNAPEQVDEILSKFNYLTGNIKPTDGQGFLRELNSKYLGLVDKNSAEASAYRAIRGALSDQLDDVYKAATGINDSPYRQWGSLQDFMQGVGNQIIKSQRAQGKKAEEGVQGVGSVTGFVKDIAAGVGLRALIPREIEAVNKGIQRIFSSEVSSLPKPSKLTQAELQSLRDKYLARPPVQAPTIPQAAVAPSAATFEQQIAELIKTYPTQLRRDPAMARAAAIGQLEGAPPVPR